MEIWSEDGELLCECTCTYFPFPQEKAREEMLYKPSTVEDEDITWEELQRRLRE